MVYWTIPLIAFGLLAVYLAVRMLLREEFTRYMCTAKWNFQCRLGVKILGLEREVVVARWRFPINILIGRRLSSFRTVYAT